MVIIVFNNGTNKLGELDYCHLSVFGTRFYDEDSKHCDSSVTIPKKEMFRNDCWTFLFWKLLHNMNCSVTP